MSKFAKLFEVDDCQVLVTLDADDDESPSLTLKTQIQGVNLSTSYGYDNSEEGWLKAENALSLVNQEMANAFHHQSAQLVKGE